MATPIAVLYACSWWHHNRRQPGWRIWISKLGIIYSILILAGMAAFLVGTPHSPEYAAFPYTYRWAPRLARASMPCLLFAIFGKGHVRVAVAIAALGGVAFAFAMIAML
ncbi:MAG: hypothetical protein ABSD63_04235 [Candidatus Korobacteraceae bacterium]